MTDPLEAAFASLREPVTPVDPEPSFAARLRERLTRAVLDQGAEMTQQLTEREPAWGPSLSPYLVVSDARAALAWYGEVFGARPRGEVYENSDGTIGHAEVDIGDAVLMFSEASDLWPDVPVRAPDSPATFSHTLHLQVPEVDAVIALARRRGATIEREPVDEPYGRVGVLVDPFGHRWLLNQPPARATRFRQGDVVHVTMAVVDAVRSKTFYEAVLQVPFVPGGSPGAWGTEETTPQFGMWSPAGTQAPEVQLCFRVDDIEAASGRVGAAGGSAGEVQRKPYGLLAECVDPDGVNFQIWQPVD